MNPHAFEQLFTLLQGDQKPDFFETMPIAAQALFQMIEFEPTYTILSLKLLEDVINDHYPIGHKPMSTTVLMMGWYVGETIRRSIPGAQWKTQSLEELEDVEDLLLEVPHQEEGAKAHLHPVTRVVKFWLDRTDTIFGWANMIKDVAEGKLNPRQGTGEWFKRPDGTMVRSIGFTIGEVVQHRKTKEKGKVTGYQHHKVGIVWNKDILKPHGVTYYTQAQFLDQIEKVGEK